MHYTDILCPRNYTAGMSSHTSNLKQKSNACAPKCISQATVTKWLSMTFHFTSMLWWSCLKQFSCRQPVSFFVHVQMTAWMPQVCSNVWKVSKMATGAMLLSLAATDQNCSHEMQRYVLPKDDRRVMIRKTIASLNLDTTKGRWRWERLLGITVCCHWAPCLLTNKQTNKQTQKGT